MATTMGKYSKGIKKIPPDGGFGWVIVAAFAICYSLLVPMITNFGLIFKDKLIAMNLSARDISFVININSAFSMSMGLISGALLRNFGYRKIGILSGSIFSIGIILCAFTNSFISLVLTYGFLAAAGFGLSISSFQLAVSTYFLENRNKAIGIGMSIAGLGPIVFPALIMNLLTTYGTNGTILILGGISIHTVMAALLLQPINWHMKRTIVQTDEEELMQSDSNDYKSDGDSTRPKFYIEKPQTNGYNIDVASEADSELEKTYNYIDHDVDMQNIYGCEQMPIVRKKSSKQLTRCNNSDVRHANSLKDLSKSRDHKYFRSLSTDANHHTINVKPPKRWFEPGSIDTINLGSAVDIFGQRLDRIESRRLMHSFDRIDEEENKNVSERNDADIQRLQTIQEKTNEDRIINAKKYTSFWRAAGRWLVKFFDLDLLRDKIYVNIMVGISIAIFAEFNFSILTPLILYEMDFTTFQVASLMSTVAISDVVSRFVSPWIGDYFEQSSRIMYMISLVFLVMIRMVFVWASSYTTMIFVMILLGIARGVRTVNLNLIIPDHVPLDRLASASGLQMVANGIFLMLFGSIVGVMRDASGSYSSSIVFMNAVTMLTVVMWSIEMIYIRFKGSEKTY